MVSYYILIMCIYNYPLKGKNKDLQGSAPATTWKHSTGTMAMSKPSVCVNLCILKFLVRVLNSFIRSLLERPLFMDILAKYVIVLWITVTSFHVFIPLTATCFHWCMMCVHTYRIKNKCPSTVRYKLLCPNQTDVTSLQCRCDRSFTSIHFSLNTF